MPFIQCSSVDRHQRVNIFKLPFVLLLAQHVTWSVLLLILCSQILTSVSLIAYAQDDTTGQVQTVQDGIDNDSSSNVDDQTQITTVIEPTAKVSPILENIISDGGGGYIANFGYYNRNTLTNIGKDVTVEIPVGNENRFNIQPQDRGQTTNFLPGRHQNTFQVVLGCGEVLVWTLKSPNGQTSTATAGAPECAEEPVTATDDTPPEGVIKFLPIQRDVPNNRSQITVAGCYYISKISHEGEGGQLYAVIDGVDTFVHDEYNDIPHYTYLGYYEAQQDLILKILPSFNQSPDEVLSTDESRVKVVQLGEEVFRFYFEDWNDQDFNDLVMEVKRGGCAQGSQIDNESLATAPQEDSRIFTAQDEIGVVYYADGDDYQDELNDILAIRFFDQNGDVIVLDVLPENGGLIPCAGSSCAFANGVSQSPLQSGWYEFSGAPYWRLISLDQDGLYEQSAEIVDVWGNVSTVTNQIIKDISAPIMTGVSDTISFGQGEVLSASVEVNLSDDGLSQAQNSPLLAPRLSAETIFVRSGFDSVSLGDWDAAGVASYTFTDIQYQLSDDELQLLIDQGYIEIPFYIQAKDSLENTSDLLEYTLRFEFEAVSNTLRFSSDTVRGVSSAEQQELGLISNYQLPVHYDAVVPYTVVLNPEYQVSKIRFAEHVDDFTDSLAWTEFDHDSDTYETDLENALNGAYDFSQNNGYEPFDIMQLCVQIEDVFGQVAEPYCEYVELTYNPDPVFDPRGPFFDQPESCTNPYGWLEMRDLRTETTKTFSVQKQVIPVEVDGVTIYKIPFYNNQGEIDYVEVAADELVLDPNPGDHPEYFDTTVCSFTDKVHYWDDSTGWWEVVDSYLEVLSPQTSERQAGYMYKNRANDFTVYFGETVNNGFWFFSDELDYRVNTITIGGHELAPNLPRVRNNSIIYPDILPGVDLQYIVHSQGVSKDFIIKDEEGRSHDLTEIVFDFVSSRKLIPSDCQVVDEGCQINFEGAETLFMSAPWTTDANGQEVVLEDYVISSDSTQLTIYPDQEYLNSPDRELPIMIDPDIVNIGSGGDSFARQWQSWAQGGPTSATRHALAVGTQVYDSFNNGYLGYSEAFMRFPLPQHVRNSGIAKAQLQVKHYNTRPGYGNFNAGIYRVGDFNELNLNWWNKPGFGHKYGDIYFGSFNSSCWNGCHRETDPRWSSDIRNLVNDSKSSGVALIGLKSNGGKNGAIFCSKEGRGVYNHPCGFGGEGPLLQVTLNNPPTPPKTELPDGDEYIGNCDLSVEPATGYCDPEYNVKFQVSNINGGDGDAGEYNLEMVNTRLHPGYRYPEAGFIGWYKGRHTRTESILNGVFDWTSRNRDNYGAMSGFAAGKRVVVDTQSPVQIGSLTVDPVTQDGQIEFKIPEFTDNIIHKVSINSMANNTAVNASAGHHGALIHLDNTNLSLNQQWTIEPSGYIRGVGNRCLHYHVATGKLIMIDCQNLWVQKWEITDNYEVKIQQFDLCLEQSIMTGGTNLYVRSCDGSIEQKFRIEGETRQRIRVDGSNFSVDFSGGFDADGREYTHLWSSHSGDNQQWLLIPKNPESDQLLIRGRGGRCLSARDRFDGARVFGWSCLNNNNQHFLYDGTQFRIADTPNLCIGVTTVAQSQSLRLLSCDNNNTKLFSLENSHQIQYPTHQLSYFVQVAEDENFETIFYEGWQSSPQFQLACVYDETGWVIPEDELDATTQVPRTCLNDNTTYHIRVKAKDRQHSLDENAINNGNISEWSEVKTVEIDLENPLVQNLAIGNERISPQNQTSVGQYDTSTISFEFSEELFERAEVHILNSDGEHVRTLTQCEIGGQTLDCNASNLGYAYDSSLSQEDPANFQQVSSIFDGLDDQGNVLPDGTYAVQAIAYDLNDVSNNPNDAIDLVIIDNSPATISITSPNHQTFVDGVIEVTGQVAGFNNSKREDNDFTLLEISKIDLDGAELASSGYDWQIVSLGMDIESEPGVMVFDETLFSRSEFLDIGLNRFAFRSTDSVGNQTSQLGDYTDPFDLAITYLDVYYDNQAPLFQFIAPEGQLDTISVGGQDVHQPLVEFTITDDSLTSELINGGFDPGFFGDYELSLLYSSFNNDNWVELPIYNQTGDISTPSAPLADILDCVREIDPSNANQFIITCGLQFDDLTLPGEYRPLIKVRDKAGNKVCNLNPDDYVLDSEVDCSQATIQTATPDFDPVVEFTIPENQNSTDVIITSPETGYLTNRGAIKCGRSWSKLNWWYNLGYRPLCRCSNHTRNFIL
jgi:hypothetical protein